MDTHSQSAGVRGIIPQVTQKLDGVLGELRGCSRIGGWGRRVPIYCKHQQLPTPVSRELGLRESRVAGQFGAGGPQAPGTTRSALTLLPFPLQGGPLEFIQTTGIILKATKPDTLVALWASRPAQPCK